MIAKRYPPGYKPTVSEKRAPEGGPSIQEWETALIGRYRSLNYAADPIDPRIPLSVVPENSVRGVLLGCVENSEGALGRVPVDVVLEIERVLFDTVRPFSSLVYILRSIRLAWYYLMSKVFDLLYV
jgi:hypothetical protein